jgi:hypothetical protein
VKNRLVGFVDIENVLNSLVRFPFALDQIGHQRLSMSATEQRQRFEWRFDHGVRGYREKSEDGWYVSQGPVSAPRIAYVEHTAALNSIMRRHGNVFTRVEVQSPGHTRMAGCDDAESTVKWRDPSQICMNFNRHRAVHI